MLKVACKKTQTTFKLVLSPVPRSRLFMDDSHPQCQRDSTEFNSTQLS